MGTNRGAGNTSCADRLTTISSLLDAASAAASSGTRDGLEAACVSLRLAAALAPPPLQPAVEAQLRAAAAAALAAGRPSPANQWGGRDGPAAAPGGGGGADDDYRVLGLAPGATGAEIRRGYRAAALALHPDKNRSEEAAARFCAVTEAYGNILRRGPC